MDKWTRLRYLPNLPLGDDGRRVTASEEHIRLSKESAKEGMVLLKNDGGLLPLAADTRLALFGKGTFDYVQGGGGSGTVYTPYYRNLYDGLTGLQVTVDEDLAAFYRSYVQEQYAAGVHAGMMVEPELPQALLEGARSFTDTAVISISRFSGESWDRGSRGQDVFTHGDFMLTDTEQAMVSAVTAAFPKVIMVLNVGGIVDTQWFYDDPAVQSVLMAWQAGMEGGTAAAELLLGIGNPCGKLADTFAKTLEDYPSTATFHEDVKYVDYTEDIYVGYRYFETIPGAGEKVNYPFGFGLSYTTFSWDVREIKKGGGTFTASVQVKNTGSIAGKEVIQIYASAPQGKLGKPSKVLVGFQKTGLLAPGEEQMLEITFDRYAFASFDDLGKVQKSAYILEKGEYTFHVGTSVRDTKKADYVYQVKEDTVMQQLTQKLAPRQLKARMLSDGSMEVLPQLPALDPFATELEPQDEMYKLSFAPAIRYVPSLPRGKFDTRQIYRFTDVAEGKVTLDEFVLQLSDEQLVYLVQGQPCTGVANTHGFGNIPEFDVPNVMTADGPAGVRILPKALVKTTCFPCSTLLACTWDPEISHAIGVAGAKEILENNMGCWLTPAVNIHRSPLCGRNFEYYSEDPVLTGIMASGMVRGIQSQKVAPSLKHFALNNKETNRKNSDSRVSERAAREIYLKAFEIVVKTADPWYIMSAYNYVNGRRCSENRELLEDILREEWGFTGMVSTDWWTCAEQYKEVKAGNDLKMPGGFPERLLEALERGLITREELRRNGKRILSVILRLA